MYWMSLRVWIALLFRLWSAWLPFPAPGLWVLSCILTGERSMEPYLDYIKYSFEKDPSTVDKQERGVESCLLQVIF